MRILCSVAALAALSGVAAAQPKTGGAAQVPEAKGTTVVNTKVGTTASPAKLPKVELFELPNGLKVAYLGTDTAPVVAVQVWYHAGSKDEPRDRRGSAHMFEHMMFKGSTHVRSEAHAQSINSLGGFVNAATDEDATHFLNTLPADQLDYAVQLEA